MSIVTHDSIAGLKDRVEIVEIVKRYVVLEFRGREWWGHCPIHADHTPSFKVNPERQLFKCFGCGSGGDVIDFLVAVERISKAGAIRRLKELAGGNAPKSAARTVMSAPRKVNPAGALALYRSALPILPGTTAASYLTARHCALPHPEGDLRFLEEYRHPSGWLGPCLLALVTDACTAAPMTLSQTWVLPDGEKAPVDRPRLLWFGLPKAGGVCRLVPDDALTIGLCVAEGAETALTAARAFQPVWATIDAANLAGLPVLPGIDCLTIIADHDRPNPRTGIRPGNDAADACTRRWTAMGVEVRRWLAPSEGDLNDFARGLA